MPWIGGLAEWRDGNTTSLSEFLLRADARHERGEPIRRSRARLDLSALRNGQRAVRATLLMRGANCLGQLHSGARRDDEERRDMSTNAERDRHIIALRREGVPIYAAERDADRRFGPAVVDKDALEDAHVAEGLKLCRALGFEMVTFSQKKRAKVTPGIPDQKLYHRRRRLTFWWEAKASWGRQSNAQKEFQAMCEAVGENYVLGGYEALTEWLRAQGLMGRDGQITPPPR